MERRQCFEGGFRTKKDAQEALVKALSSVHEGKHLDPSDQTLGDYLLEEWLPARKPTDDSGRGHRGQLSIGTWADYRGIITAYVVPRVGAVPLQKLSSAYLNQLYDQLESSGGRQGRPLSAKTVLNVHRVLHKALGDAVREGKLAHNPADMLWAPTAPRASTDVWSVEQLRTFLDHVSSERFYAAWLLFATTGMRRGEVAGLTWSDLDLDEGRLRVTMTLGVVDGKATWKPRPKSAAGERTMSLDPATMEALSEHRQYQIEQRRTAGVAWQTRQYDWQGHHRDDLVFTHSDGTLIYPQSFTTWFRDHCGTAGLPRIRLHDVRHTYATAGLASAEGWYEVKVISERLGHASIGITLDTYSHVLPAADQETANTLARVILGDAA